MQFSHSERYYIDASSKSFSHLNPLPFSVLHMESGKTECVFGLQTTKMLQNFNPESLHKNDFKLFHIPHLTSWLLAYIAIEASSLHQNHCVTSQLFISPAMMLSVKKNWSIRENIFIFIELLKGKTDKTVMMGWTRSLPGAARTCTHHLCIKR